uniref:Serine proteinase inhibitor serpin-4 n=1 Tax=Rhipicephalus appendiculatus TaxID=34631 RepID=Q8WQW8_RHIAP|nr:serine proteinase inhibitor serpin-4 [Rhipicephalus appendiculatus]
MKLIICLAGLLALCSGQEEHKVTAANNEFGFKLLNAIPVSPQTNLFYSPYSGPQPWRWPTSVPGERLSVTFTRHWATSSVGLTPEHVPSAHAQHTHLLRAPSNPNLSASPNAAVVQESYTVTDEYLDFLRQYFDAEVSVASLNDELIREGNLTTGSKNKTEQKIQQLSASLFLPTRGLVLLNAIYFKGLWNVPFDTRGTRKGPFFNAGTERVEVDVMNARLRVGYAGDDQTNVDVLDLPYAGLDYSLTIILPRERTGVDALRQNLSWPVFQRLLSKVHMNTRVLVALPRFKIEGSYKLEGPLSALGASKAFDERHADFSGISGARDLGHIRRRAQAVVEVNEEGAAAATRQSSSKPRSSGGAIRFVVDHPFLFFIRNRHTGDVLFAGHVNHLQIDSATSPHWTLFSLAIKLGADAGVKYMGRLIDEEYQLSKTRAMRDWTFCSLVPAPFLTWVKPSGKHALIIPTTGIPTRGHYEVFWDVRGIFI